MVQNMDKSQPPKPTPQQLEQARRDRAKTRQRKAERQFAQELRQTIKDMGLTQVKLSRTLRVHDKQVTTYLSGGRSLFTGTARRMLAELRVRVRLEPIPPTCGDCQFFNNNRCEHPSYKAKAVLVRTDTPGCAAWTLLR